jgi:hypothetical protein
MVALKNRVVQMFKIEQVCEQKYSAQIFKI